MCRVLSDLVLSILIQYNLVRPEELLLLLQAHFLNKKVLAQT